MSNRTAPPRSTMNNNHVILAQPKLSDFTEDPFRDYRYEDPFNITDPFADETEDQNRNRETGRTDLFGSFETISTFSSDKNISAKGFENDFSNTFPLTKAKHEKNDMKFEADFGKAFSSNGKNIRGIRGESDFSYTFANVKTKTIDLDEAFSTKDVKTIMGHESDRAHVSKAKVTNKDEKLMNYFDKMWNGNNITDLSEAQQLAWAEKQSIKAEKERLKRNKEKEDAELALAIELSRQGKSGNI